MSDLSLSRTRSLSLNSLAAARLGNNLEEPIAIATAGNGLTLVMLSGQCSGQLQATKQGGSLDNRLPVLPQRVQ